VHNNDMLRRKFGIERDNVRGALKKGITRR
jgi:hypothetical protein